ncbi:MAG: hypothetical protein KatS3mg125_1112 [Lysobacterales bacterium]|nr:MAG: hypothetical protein KatS3mg125_1112 [Xanthomonadales bacterium]
MLKTLSFGLLHVSVAFTVTWLLTGSAAIGGLVALIEPLCNTIAYHWHEKAWTRFGRPRPVAPT